ncbi:MAG: Bax inhibitor-1/YccA family protein [Barnesiella sp.]|nr:Bax inhibitor-1/YccA family protein [Barnesiella sp.]MBD5246681.1 Bax inhibitor-1/YccA family protein [Barnesiella sp.]
MNYSNYSNYTSDQQYAVDMRTSQVMKRVYVKMFLALLVTALTSLWVANSPSMANALLSSRSIYWILAIVEIGLVIAITGAINKISSSTATLLFFLFAIVNGFTLSVIFFVYSPGSIAKTFFITAGTFGAMSVYGYFTNRDLTKVGSFLFFALIGLIIATVVNIFAHSDTLGWIISFAGVLIFLGLTAWDTQKIKQSVAVTPNESLGKLATIGALSLYLDFINLFIYLLRFFGDRN